MICKYLNYHFKIITVVLNNTIFIMNLGYAYIVSNQNRTVFYTGVTNDIYRRTHEHKSGEGSVFTKRYKLTDLVYYEFFDDIRDAIQREKELKNWHRPWKIRLITENNAQMKDLAFTELGFNPNDYK